jgi:alpha-D-ribose 1-methylphosphonate 5-triphosphate synthase subunit PhnL
VNARTALRSRLEVLKTEGVAMLGVFHHPEDVTGLVNSELEVARPDGDSGDERDLEQILEASYVAH